jgi:hypothetical protein
VREGPPRLLPCQNSGARMRSRHEAPFSTCADSSRLLPDATKKQSGDRTLMQQARCGRGLEPPAAAGPAAGSAAWHASCGYCTRQLCWSWLAPQPPRRPHPAHIGTKCEAQRMLRVVIHSTGLVSCEASHPVLGLWRDKSCQVSRGTPADLVFPWTWITSVPLGIHSYYSME